MVVIPAGTFDMGIVPGEGETDSDEVPQHSVRIEKAFAVGVHEVTRGQFEQFVRATGYDAGDECQVHAPDGWKKVQGASWRNPGFDQTPKHPVVCVSWLDAQAYVEWLSRQTRGAYRLLSEAEWEYIAGADTRISDVSIMTHDKANYGEEKCCGPKTEGNDRWEYTAPVGSFKANSFALYDVRGNVWEWLQDCYHEDYRGAPTDGTARTSGCSHADRRALRGGSWGDPASSLRPAYRLRGSLDGRYFTLGFRIARDLTGMKAGLPRSFHGRAALPSTIRRA
ncbi:MAG: formylglycine-generating enzyme family protein [Steroidobacteraceae bacterium]